MAAGRQGQVRENGPVIQAPPIGVGGISRGTGLNLDHGARRTADVDAGIHVDGQAPLSKVVGALDLTGGCLRAGQDGQQQGRQNGDDRYNYQQFN